jgi:Cytosine/adenosine deaminases
MNNFKLYIDTLLKLCNQAIKRNEIPVSAIIVDPKSKKIIAKAYNLSLTNKDLGARRSIGYSQSFKGIKNKKIGQYGHLLFVRTLHNVCCSYCLGSD